MRSTERPSRGSKRLATAAAVIVAALSTGCQAAQAGAGGGFATLAGEAPARGRLVEELSIGVSDGPGEYKLGIIADVAVGTGGRILVADNTAGVVREYDSAGRFVRNFGGEGSGRGEVISPKFVAVAPDGRVLVGDLAQSGARDAGRIHVYSADGTYLETWNLGQAIEGPLTFDRSGTAYVRMAGAVRSSGEVSMRISPAIGLATRRSVPRTFLSTVVIKNPDFPITSPGAVRLRADGSVVDTIRVPSSGAPPLHWLNDTTGVRVFVGHSYAPVHWYAFSPSGNILSGNSTDYLIDVRGAANGRQLFQLRRDVAPVPVVAEEREEIRELLEQTPTSQRGQFRRFGPADAPSFKPAYHSVLITREGAAWVGLYLPSVRRAGEWDEPATAYDVWDPSGGYVGRVDGPRAIQQGVVEGNSLVSWSWNATDGGRVVRYRVVWD